MSVKELFGLLAASEAKNGVKSELKPCPFCKAQLVETEPGSMYFSHPGGMHCILDGFDIDVDGNPELVARWNRRAQPAEEVQRDRLLAALERAATAESALRRLADECENDATPGWEDRMRDRIADAERILKDTP